MTPSKLSLKASFTKAFSLIIIILISCGTAYAQKCKKNCPKKPPTQRYVDAKGIFGKVEAGITVSPVELSSESEKAAYAIYFVCYLQKCLDHTVEQATHKFDAIFRVGSGNDSGNSSNSGTFTDNRGGKTQTYKWVKLDDGNIWMAENLNFEIGESECYKNNDENCQKFGRLYNWEDVSNACPDGWHLPSDDEWLNLANTYGGYHDWKTGIDKGSPKKSYRRLTKKSIKTFSASLGGEIDGQGKTIGLNEMGYYWTDTSSDVEGDTNRSFYYKFSRASSGTNKLFRFIGDENTKFSCRCIKDKN